NPVLQIADESGIVQISRRLNLSNTTKSIMYRNSRPDEKAIHDLNQFTRTIDLGLLLYGQWISQNDQVFNATFSRNPKDMDHITQKRIRSDKVRTIAVVIEGSAAEIPVFTNMLDHQELNRLIIP
ncbi:MAG TPA: hypothetical protein VFV08_09860, partial [Puia sp.]|nr:hypothetical protein [Puia sp.]